MFFQFKLALAHLFANPARTLLTMLGMIAAATLAAWTVASYDGALSQHNQSRGDEQLGNYDFFIVPSKDGKDSELLDPQQRCDMLPTEHYSCTEVSLRTSTDRATPATDLVAPPPLKGLPLNLPYVIGCNALKPPRQLESGHWLNHNDNELSDPEPPFPCVVNISMAKRFDLRLQTVFAVGSHAGSFLMQVIGIIEDADSKNQQAIWRNLSPTLDPPILNGIFVNWSTAEHIAGGKLKADYLGGYLNQGKLEVQVKKLLQNESLVFVNAESLRHAAQKIQRSDTRLRMQSWTASGLALLIAFFIIFTSLSMGVEERIRQYALLRAVALTRRQLAINIFCESLLFAIVGWLGGLLAGGLLLKYFSQAAILQNPMQRGNILRLIGYNTVLLTALCSILGALAAAALPAWRAARKDILSALQPNTLRDRRRISFKLCIIGLFLPLIQILIITQPGLTEMSRVKLYSLLGCPSTAIGFVLAAPLFLIAINRLLTPLMSSIFRLPLPFLRSQLDANLWRSSGTVVALSLGLGFYMTVLIWSASLLKPFLPGDWLPSLFAAVVPGGIQESDYKLVKQLPGLKPETCLPVYVEQCQLAEDLTDSARRQNVVRQNNVTMLGLSVEAAYSGKNPLLPFDFVSDKQSALQKLAGAGNYCLVPTFFAEVTGLSPGDSFSLISPDNPQKTISYEIAGLIRLDGWHWFSKYSGTRRHYARTSAMIFCSDESLKRNFNLQRINYFWSQLKPDFQEKQFKSALQELADSQAGQSFHVSGRGQATVGKQSVKLTLKSALHSSIMRRTEQILSGMLRMPKILLWIMSLAVANTALASIRVRRQEIGLMRALGLDRWGLMRLLLAETLLIAISGISLSLTYGLFSGLCSAKMAMYISFFGGMGWNFAVPWSRILEGSLLMLLVCFTAAVIPALLALRPEPLELMQTEQ
ncbi:MAG: ABC transporter permease [Oligosphaeraceae bacterium]|nr:ABC transporter permease [Oligosphaeraceae bacterium]